MARRSPGEGSITKRPDGRWQARLQVDGVRRSVYGRTRQEVAQRLDDLKRQAARAGALPDPGRRTLGDLLDAWLEAKAPQVRPVTLAGYAATCDRYVRPALGRLPLARVTPDRIERLCARYRARGQNRTALKVYTVLSQALAVAVRWAWLAHNPCDRVDRPRYRPPRVDPWTLHELRAFLDGTRERWLWPLWVVLATSGLRLGEALALTWADVDPGAGTLTVREAKTPAGVRTVSLPREGVGALRRQAEWRLAQGSGGDTVFAGAGGGPLSATTVQHALHRECRRLGLPGMTPHGFRHLHASLLLAEGLPVPEVSRRLGHATPAITMAVYAHAIGHEDRGAEAMERALGEGRSG